MTRGKFTNDTRKVYIGLPIMSLTSFEEVMCPCGEVFEAELVSAVNAGQHPFLKDTLMSGGLNVVACPSCNTLFYAERFLLYIDLAEELVAFVYPKSYSDESHQWQEKMHSDFEKARSLIDADEGNGGLEYPPVILFGMDSLVELLQKEQSARDEIEMLEIASAGKGNALSVLRLKPVVAREMHLPPVLPRVKSDGNDLRKEVISGLEKLLEIFPDMEVFRGIYERIRKDDSFKINPGCLK
ncbi:MAG: CpXC domain-containing protein [Elusimicrobiota bacterium]